MLITAASLDALIEAELSTMFAYIFLPRLVESVHADPSGP
jgi:hypothetical protein